MNIFFLHWSPRKCAKYHCDKHVVKMILESCQLLYTCHWSQKEPPTLIHTAPGGGYKPTHRKHPCALWLLESLDNYRWLIQLTQELIDEYHYRYSDREHACEKHLDWLRTVEPHGLPCAGFTPPRCAMPPEYKISNDATINYRAYYRGAKKHLLQYRKRHAPHFL
jgi:hypothetical protein